MNCCHNQGLEDQFNQRRARRELTDYLRHGPNRSTQLLVDALVAQGVRDATLLDIGGGVGAIQHALLEAGTRATVHVDVSQAYLAVAREESARRQTTERTHFIHGDFVAQADTIAPAEIVTLDRVLCCYPDMPTLVERSATKAKRLYGFVVPQSTWWMQFAKMIINGAVRLERSSFRFFVHSPEAIRAILSTHGFAPLVSETSGVWQVNLYKRLHADDS